MSFFGKIETLADEAWDKLEGSNLAKLIDNGYNAALAEIKDISADELDGLVEEAIDGCIDRLPGIISGIVSDAASSVGILALSPATIQHLASAFTHHLLASLNPKASSVTTTSAPPAKK